MTYTVKTSDLKRALRLAMPCVGKRVYPPVLANFRLDFTDGLLVTSSDLDQTVDARISASGEGADVVLVDGKRLNGIVGLLNDDELKFDVVEGKLKLTRSAGTLSLTTTDPDIYPNTPDPSDVEGWTMFDASVLYKTFRTCLIGTVDGEIGLTNSGNKIVDIHVNSNEFECFATDGRRLSVVTGKCEPAQEEAYKISLPVYAIKTLLPSLDSDATIFIGEDKNHIFVKLSDAHICSFRKITAQLPNIRFLLEKLKYERFITSKSEDVARSLDIVRQVASERNRRVDWAFGDSGITLSAASEDGTIEEVLQAGIDFEPDATAFDFSYVLPIFKHMSGDVEMAFSKEHIIIRDRLDETKILDEHDSWTIRVSSENGVKSSVIVQGLKVQR